MSCSSSYHEQFAHLHIPLDAIVSATDNFSDANLIGEETFGMRYRGRLLQSGQRIDIVARRFDGEMEGQGNKFWMEVSMLSRLEHQNIVSILGFCEQDGEKIVIYKHDGTRGDLYDHLADPTLTWMQRLQICVGVVQALSHIHYDEGRDLSVIHRDITSPKILLDGLWEPKLSGFELSISQPAAERGCPFRLPKDDIWFTRGYVDPTYSKTGIVSDKSDLFSLGVVLFEVLCGKGTKPLKGVDKMYLYQSAKLHFEEETLLYNFVTPSLRNQMGPESFNIFSKAAYSCLNKHPLERPSIDQIVIQLEKALESQRIYENQFAHLRIPLAEIVSATNNFSDSNFLREDGFIKEYTGQLLRSGQCIDVVARMFSDETEGQGDKEFWMEVLMLSRLEHKNIVSIVGFCEEDGQKIVIRRHESTRGELYDHLTDPRLTWRKRLQICVGVGDALSYIHYDEGRDFSVIHRDITSYNILLDDRWEPRLSGFEISILQPTAERGRPFQVLDDDDMWSTEGCSDPRYIKTGSVSHKSDIFSLGVVLLELLCGKTATETVNESDEMYLYQSAKSHFERETLLYDLVTPRLRNQMTLESFNIFSKTAYECLKTEPSERPSINQILTQLDKALESQRIYDENRFAHLRIPLEDIVSATNNFSDANFLRKDGFVKEYKGQLLRSGQCIDIVARRLNETKEPRDTEFWMEVSMLVTLEHQNIVSIVGFCHEEDGEKIIINKHESPRGELYDHLRDPTLRWMQRLQICVGVGHALSYIHYDEGRDFSVIHRNIKSSKILLDDRWEPKLSGFEFSISRAAAERGRPYQLPDDEVIWSTQGFSDPTYIETRSVSHKSDMFSLGVVLFQVLCGKRATETVMGDDDTYLYQSAKSHFEEETLYDLVHPGLRNQMGPESFIIFSKTAYECLKAKPSERPSIDQIVTQLDRALESQQIYENRFTHLRIPLEEIVSATNNFSDANFIWEDGFIKEYKGQFLRSGQLIDIVARRFLDEMEEQRDTWFWTEVSMLSRLEHQNIVSIIGFCEEGGEKIVIHKHASTRGHLHDYLTDPALTWMQRLHICVGVGHALSYIHYDEGRDFSVIHRDITSSKILVDDRWEPKLSCFELSISQPAAERNRPCQVPDDNFGFREGYSDPTYIETQSASHKSDIFSLGVVLMQVLCGKRATETVKEEKIYLYQSAISHYREGRVHDLVHLDLGQQMGTESIRIFSEIAYSCLNEQLSERPSIDHIVIQLAKALESQRIYENEIRLAHLRIPLEKIVSATNNFSDANFLRKDGFIKEYKGQLLRSGQPVDIIARRLDDAEGKRKEWFWMEVSMLATLEHQNIVSIMGFCDEIGEMIILNKADESMHGNLYQHLRDPSLMTWMRRLQICVGVARALSYIYYEEGRYDSIIHRDIKSAKILLDDNWEAKLSGFELSMTQTTNERNRPYQVPDDDIWATPVCCDPTYMETGIVSHKSDMFSFGVVLIEVIYSKGTVVVNKDGIGMYLYESAISHYRDGSIYNLVHPGLGKQMGPESFNIFSETAYSCLNEQPSERPSIDQILIQLEKALESQQIYENRFAHLRFPLAEIVSGTDNFSDANLIREDEFIKEYKGRLLRSGQWIDIVARRFLDDATEQRDTEFWTEVSMLSRLEHQYIVSIVGFCEEDGHKIVIYKHESTRGNLYDHLTDPTLTWMLRLEICVGVARALSYIHYDKGRDFSVIHRDIISYKILLDDRWEPKLSGFELSISQPTAKRARPFQVPDDDDIWSTPGCSDPTYIETRTVSHKSDMFSLGVVLFQVLCRKPVKEADEMHLYQSAKSHFEGDTLLYDLVTPGLRNQMGPESFNIFSKTAYDCLKAEPSERPSIDQILTQLDKALESQRIYENRFAHLQIPLEEIVSATNNFSDANFNREDEFGKEFKGKLLWSDQLVDIVARRLYNTKGKGKEWFWMEVSMLATLQHQNIVSIMGFCDENGENIIIYKHENTHGNLYQHLRDPTLTWMRRLQICVGVAHALSYIYYDEGRDFSIIHRNINSKRILLDGQWEPKLSGFEVSISRTAAERNSTCWVPDDDIWFTPGCCDPRYYSITNLSHKSDMFSLGVVLMQVLCGKGTTKMVKKDEMYLYQSAKSHYREGRLYDLVQPDLVKQMGSESFKIFSEIAYCCLNDQWSKRPSIDHIIIQLEKAMESQRIYENRLAHLQIPLEEIVSATNNFSDANLIGEDLFGKEYQGQLLRSGQLVDIVARRLDETKGQGNKEFWTEVSMLSTLEHQNIVSIMGFCDENREKIVIKKHESTCGNLYQHLKDPTLTWMQRLHICVGVAHALSYIYYDEGRDYSVIHRDITSSKILLDEQWKPKLSGFEHSLKQAAAQPNHPCHLRAGIWGTPGYMDPTYLETQSVSHKSDMFSLGVVLMEVLCGMGTETVEEDEMYLYQLAKSRYEEKRLNGLVNLGLWKQMAPQSFKIFSETAYWCLNAEPSERPSIDQIVIELQKALESQRGHDEYFAHLQIPLKKIASATDNFSDANLIKGSELGKVYRGQLLWSEQVIDIVAQRFDNEDRDQDVEFWKEIWMLSTLEHKNVISMVGFCVEYGKIIIYKHEAKGSLETFLTDPSLTWMQRLHICVGVARALSYIHYGEGRDFSIIHCDIRSSKIFLDDNWEAKLSGFELSLKLAAAVRNDLFFTGVCGTHGYRDPQYDRSGSVTHKSDIYSLGVVLFEVLSGKKAVMVDEDTRLLAAFAKSQYEVGRLDDMIDPDLRKQMDPQSLKVFSDIAYLCLKEQRSQRPNIGLVVMELEKALESQWKHEKSLILKASIEGTSSKEKSWKHLQIPLTNIKAATKNFNNECLIGSGGYGKVYRAKLDHFDSEKLLSLEEKSIGELPKRRSIVAIKRIKIREDDEGEKGFFAEIEMLFSCKHPNIVSLLGFCEEGREMILVYEHASRGSLSGYLGSSGNSTNLSWVQRLKISIDIACGLNYLHTKLDEKRMIIHRDIKSDNILLSGNWEAKIADFGLSKFRPQSQQVNDTIYTRNIAGTELYLDPEYYTTGKLKNESDIYSLGVVLFEILSGRFANDAIYTKENRNGIAHVARRRFNDKTIKKMVDPRLPEETHVSIFTQNRGPRQDSLKAFVEIAYRCIAESQAERPPAEEVMKKLEEALFFQENIKDQLKFSIKDIELATKNFSNNNLIGRGRLGQVYKGEVTLAANGRSNTIAAKRLDKKGHGEKQFLMELQVLMEYKHENIIGLVGYCNEMDERITLYEYASRGSLNMQLSDSSLTWMKRLEICFDIATALHFLHGGGSDLTQDVVIHRDIKSSNVLLTHDWKAKITGFGVSLISPISKDMDSIIDDVVGTAGYVDPVYLELGFLTEKSDIFSLGVVLFEILSGRFAVDVKFEDMHRFLDQLVVKHNYKEGKLDEMVFEGIKEQIAPKSLTTFQTIALQCLHLNREERPTTREVLVRLKEALEFQEDYELWEPKLPKDYKEIFQMSDSPDIYSTLAKDLYNMLCNGILLQQGKLLFTLNRNGERNEMIPAKSFSYIKRCLHKWQSVPESRFQEVAEMLDILNLKIKIKTKTQLLSPDVMYGVYLVFKFCDPRNVTSKPVYVNLKYKKESKGASHAYFATWRDNEWMMIELCRFLNDKKDMVLEFLLESLSGYYCRNSTIYVEGIEFRAIDNVKHEEIKELKKVQKSDLNMDLLQQLPTNSEEIVKRSENDDGSEKLFSLNEVNGKKHLMLSAKAVIYNNADVKLFKTNPSNQTRFLEVIELLPQQVFRINCTIKSQMLSQDTEYACYLVFKLSGKCRGLHCPVKVRDLLHRNNKEVEIIYFRSPSPWNLHDTNQAPEQRADGWMEVKVWKFKIDHELKSENFRVNLKLISYEGTMSGLTVCGLEFRPM